MVTIIRNTSAQNIHNFARGKNTPLILAPTESNLWEPAAKDQSKMAYKTR